MADALFYHLTRSPVEQLLPVLLEKSRAAGWRVVVRGADPARMQWLDERLWLGPEEGFVPHGLAGGPHDALQPVLLTCGRDIPNAAECLISIDGAEVLPGEAAALTRVAVLFDGADADAVARARGQWKALSGAGLAAQYWSEAEGRWRKERG
ncbi:DNA polymerase III subunit chi [Alkalilacustris brevis]|uniref:DNA polymerase III subunit chi n=1 Tax=Alkalilacustris brevis TaxID=2026338 RepID=UPI00192E5326|nr:DNA polymerase III subunit chi [Alkalilacustris brevis]